MINLLTKKSLINRTDYKYLVCESSYAIADNERVFNTISDCITYIGNDIPNRLGKIFVKKKADESNWEDNIRLDTGGDWSGFEIEFEKDSKLVPKLSWGDSSDNDFGGAIFVSGLRTNNIQFITNRIWSYSGGVFTKTSGSNLTSLTENYIHINKIEYKISSMNATSITIDTTYRTYTGRTDNIIIDATTKGYYYKNIKIKCDITSNEPYPSIGSLRYGLSVCCADVVFEGSIENLQADDAGAGNTASFIELQFWNFDAGSNYYRDSGTALQCCLSNVVMYGNINNCNATGNNCNGAVNCNYANLIINGNIENCENQSPIEGNTIAGGLRTGYSNVKINNIINCRGFNGGAINSDRSYITVNNIENCQAWDINYGDGSGGGAYLVLNSILNFNKIKNCSAYGSGGALYMSDSIVEGNEIDNCKSQEGSNGGGICIFGYFSLKVKKLTNCYTNTQGGAISFQSTSKGYAKIDYAQGNSTDGYDSDNYYNSATAGKILLDLVKDDGSDTSAGNALATGSRVVTI